MPISIAYPTVNNQRDIITPVEAKNGMVVTDNNLATQIGLTVLTQGGNAIDAAVTIGFVMAVTYPQAGNIGGGGFMLIHHAPTKQVIAIDYRETAPAKARPDMFLDQDNHVNPKLSRFSHRAVGIPGTVAGLALALEKYGTFSLAQALAPAINLAKEGFVVSKALSESIKQHLPKDHSQLTPAIFFNARGQVYEPGELLIQKNLANTLNLLAKAGTSAFYHGQIANLIVAEMEIHGGLITKDDLARYQPIIRQPVQGSYRGYDIYSMSPPSSGGVHIIQILNILEKDDIKSLGHNSAATIHLLAEAMKRAYADRSKYLGDPDF
ncbi:MAG: gamma-glutamyltransferase family protein [Thioploca sp.]|nr:gamma-glutamyltransferase family protein [Thioploca sp.]